VRAYLAGTGGSFTESMRAVVYADASGLPGRLLGSTSASAFGGSLKPGWVELKFASALRLRSGTYWLGLQFGGATRVLRVGFVSGAAGIGRYNEDGWADGPSPVFGSGSGDHEAWSVYAVAASPSARLLDAKRSVKRARTKKQGHPKRPAAHRR
jgi:hypothetical protein